VAAVAAADGNLSGRRLAASISTMAATLPTHSLTYAEYLALERTTDTRHEYLAGAAWMISGGTPRHAGIKTNLTVAVATALGKTPCRPYDADLKIRVVATGLATYPDLSVICGGLETDPEDPNAVTNPAVLFEVLSPSTEAWDRGGKFQHAQQIPSLRHYVLIGQGEPFVEVYTRTDAGWLYTTHRAGENAALTGIGATLAVDALYENLPPVPDASSAG